MALLHYALLVVIVQVVSSYVFSHLYVIPTVATLPYVFSSRGNARRWKSNRRRVTNYRIIYLFSELTASLRWRGSRRWSLEHTGGYRPRRKQVICPKGVRRFDDQQTRRVSRMLTYRFPIKCICLPSDSIKGHAINPTCCSETLWNLPRIIQSYAYIHTYISSLWQACQYPNECLAEPSAASSRIAPLTFRRLLDSRSRAGCCWRTEPVIPLARGRWWSSSSPRIYCSAFADIAAVGNRQRYP